MLRLPKDRPDLSSERVPIKTRQQPSDITTFEYGAISDHKTQRGLETTIY
jgi:hypothetical protein